MRREPITIEVDDASDVPMLAWMMIAYEAGKGAQVPARLAIALGALVAGILIGVRLS